MMFNPFIGLSVAVLSLLALSVSSHPLTSVEVSIHVPSGQEYALDSVHKSLQVSYSQEQVHALDPPTHYDRFTFRKDPYTVVGFIQPTTYDLIAEFFKHPTYLGTVKGNAREGVGYHWKKNGTAGGAEFSVKNENELWIYLIASDGESLIAGESKVWSLGSPAEAHAALTPITSTASAFTTGSQIPINFSEGPFSINGTLYDSDTLVVTCYKDNKQVCQVAMGRIHLEVHFHWHEPEKNTDGDGKFYLRGNEIWIHLSARADNTQYLGDWKIMDFEALDIAQVLSSSTVGALTTGSQIPINFSEGPFSITGTLYEPGDNLEVYFYQDNNVLLGYTTGSMHDDVIFVWGGRGGDRGDVKFYLNGNELWIHLDAWAHDEHYLGEWKLMSLETLGLAKVLNSPMTSTTSALTTSTKIPINFSEGPFTITGTVYKPSDAIEVYLYQNKKKLGNRYGSIHNNLHFGWGDKVGDRGNAKVHALGNDLWLHLDAWADGKHYLGDWKILTFATLNMPQVLRSPDTSVTSSFATGLGYPFTFIKGPISITGSLDTQSLKLEATFSKNDKQLGTAKGNIVFGVWFNWPESEDTKGQASFYLKNGYELWIIMDAWADGIQYKGDWKIGNFYYALGVGQVLHSPIKSAISTFTSPNHPFTFTKGSISITGSLDPSNFHLEAAFKKDDEVILTAAGNVLFGVSFEWFQGVEEGFRGRFYMLRGDELWIFMDYNLDGKSYTWDWKVTTIPDS